MERAVVKEDLAITNCMWKGWAQTCSYNKSEFLMTSELKPLWYAAVAAAAGPSRVELLSIIIKNYLDLVSTCYMRAYKYAIGVQSINSIFES